MMLEHSLLSMAKSTEKLRFVFLLFVFVTSSDGNSHFLFYLPRFPPLYRSSHCNLHVWLRHHLPAFESQIFLDLLSDTVMAMQNKQTIWIAAGFLVGI